MENQSWISIKEKLNEIQANMEMFDILKDKNEVIELTNYIFDDALYNINRFKTSKKNEIPNEHVKFIEKDLLNYTRSKTKFKNLQVQKISKNMSELLDIIKTTHDYVELRMGIDFIFFITYPIDSKISTIRLFKIGFKAHKIKTLCIDKRCGILKFYNTTHQLLKDQNGMMTSELDNNDFYDDLCDVDQESAVFIQDEMSKNVFHLLYESYRKPLQWCYLTSIES